MHGSDYQIRWLNKNIFKIYMNEYDRFWRCFIFSKETHKSLADWSAFHLIGETAFCADFFLANMEKYHIDSPITVELKSIVRHDPTQCKDTTVFVEITKHL